MRRKVDRPIEQRRRDAPDRHMCMHAAPLTKALRAVDYAVEDGDLAAVDWSVEDVLDRDRGATAAAKLPRDGGGNFPRVRRLFLQLS